MQDVIFDKPCLRDGGRKLIGLRIVGMTRDDGRVVRIYALNETSPQPNTGSYLEVPVSQVEEVIRDLADVGKVPSGNYPRYANGDSPGVCAWCDGKIQFAVECAQLANRRCSERLDLHRRCWSDLDKPNTIEEYQEAGRKAKELTGDPHPRQNDLDGVDRTAGGTSPRQQE